MNNISVTIHGKRELERDMHQAGSKINRKTEKFLLNQAIHAERVAKKEVPVDTAQTQNSIRIERNAGRLGYKVKAHAKYAWYVHEGRKPGKMPPIDAVESWAKRKGIDPFLVARAIGRKGTKGKKFMDIAYRERKNPFKLEANKLLVDIVRSI